MHYTTLLQYVSFTVNLEFYIEILHRNITIQLVFISYICIFLF